MDSAFVWNKIMNVSFHKSLEFVGIFWDSAVYS